MAKEAGPLQPIAKMKPALMASKRAPVPFAFSVNKDDGEGVLWLLKKGKAKGALAKMKKEAKSAGITLDTSKTRFGMAEVDKEEDARRVVFRVNKDIGNAIRPKLLPLIKKCGLGSCSFTIDESLEDEEFDESAPEESEEDDAPAAAPAAESAEAAPAPADAATAEPATAEASAAAPEASSDAAGMTKRLTGLVKRMMAVMGTKPAGADAMKTAAMAAQSAIKANDMDAAAASADTLERLLDAADQAGAGAGAGQPGQAGGAKNGVGSPVFAKARTAWVATRQRVEADLDKLHEQLQATYKDHGVVADLETVFRSKVEPMMQTLDGSLADKLDEIAQTTDPAAHAKLVGEARAIIGRFESYLGSEPMIAKLDQNPFVPLSIEKTLTASLTALSKAVA